MWEYISGTQKLEYNRSSQNSLVKRKVVLFDFEATQPFSKAKGSLWSFQQWQSEDKAWLPLLRQPILFWSKKHIFFLGSLIFNKKKRKN